MVPDDHLEGEGSHLRLYKGKRIFRQLIIIFKYKYYRFSATRFLSHLGIVLNSQLPEMETPFCSRFRTLISGRPFDGATLPARILLLLYAIAHHRTTLIPMPNPFMLQSPDRSVLDSPALSAPPLPYRYLRTFSR